MTERYFDDFQVGERFTSRGATLTESQIIDFALQYDPQPFHIDAEAAARTPYAGLIASGFHTLALSFRMFLQEGVFAHSSLGSPGIDQLRWLLPVRPGDTLHVEARITAARPSRSRPDRGLLNMEYRTVNQHGETVMSMQGVQLVRRRPTAG